MSIVSKVCSSTALHSFSTPLKGDDQLSSMILTMKSLLGIGGGAILSADDLKGMLAGVKDRIVHEKAHMKALIDLFDGLYDQTRSVEDLRVLFDACPQKDALSYLMWTADGASSIDPTYGEKKIHDNPRALLQALMLLKKETLGDLSFLEIAQAFESYQKSAFGMFIQPIIAKGLKKQLQDMLTTHSFCADELNGAFKLACIRSTEGAESGAEGLKMVELLLTDKRSRRLIHFKLALEIAHGLSNEVLIKLVSDKFNLPFDPKLLLIDGSFITKGLLASALEQAAKENDLGVVKFILSSNRDLLEVDLGSIVRLAAQRGHLEVVQFLLSEESFISDGYIARAVSDAAGGGYLEVVRFLLSYRAFSDLILERALCDAAAGGHLEMVQFLLSEGKSIKVCDLGIAVRYAAAGGHLEMVQFLLSKLSAFSDVDLRQAVKNAALSGHLEIVSFLSRPFKNSENLKIYLDYSHKEIQDSTQRQFILEQLLSIFYDSDLFSKFVSLVETLSGNDRIRSAAIILMVYRKAFGEEDPTLHIQDKLSKYKEVLKGSEYARPLFAYLEKLNRSQIDKKSEILLSLFDETLSIKNTKKTLRELIAYMNCLLSISQIDWLDEFLSKTAIEDKKSFLFERIQRCIQDNFLPSGMETFTKEEFLKLESQRAPGALLSYMKTVSEYKSVLGSAYSRFLLSIIRGDFSKLRYEDLCSSHIEKLKKEYGGIWERWKTQVIPDSDLSIGDKSSNSLNFLEYIKEKFHDGHHIIADGTEHPLLLGFKDFLAASKEEQAAQYQEMCRAPRGAASILQKALMELALKKEMSQSEAFEKILNLFEGQPDCPLLHDLRGYQTSLSQKLPNSDCFITNTDDWQDLFLSGTEVIGSCQSIQASSRTNCCLMGYVLDGKNRMVAIKSAKTGKIQARAIFRILFKEERPALFIDRVYSCFPSCPQGYAEAIVNHAKDVATHLGLDLYTLQGIRSKGDTCRLDSLGSSVEYEYEDAAVGERITNGVYTITQAELV